jgi:hypothetical protein
LHNKKVRIIDIQLHRVKQIGHLPRRRIPPINQILALAPDQHLPRHVDLLALLVSHGTAGFVLVVEHDGDGGLVDARLALFVNELGEVAGADLREVLNAQDEADGVEDVGFAGAVEARYGVEVRVEAVLGRWTISWDNDNAINSNKLQISHPAITVR